jgi:Holliday junction resolvase
MTGTHLTARTVLYDAVGELNRAGYCSIRIAGSGRLFDLVAWSRKRILFLTIRRARNGGISQFSEEIGEITSLINQNPLPGMVQFWVYSSHTWQVYQVLPGGALRIRGGIHESL